MVIVVVADAGFITGYRSLVHRSLSMRSCTNYLVHSVVSVAASSRLDNSETFGTHWQPAAAGTPTDAQHKTAKDDPKAFKTCLRQCKRGRGRPEWPLFAEMRQIILFPNEGCKHDNDQRTQSKQLSAIEALLLLCGKCSKWCSNHVVIGIDQAVCDAHDGNMVHSNSKGVVVLVGPALHSFATHSDIARFMSKIRQTGFMPHDWNTSRAASIDRPRGGRRRGARTKREIHMFDFMGKASMRSKLQHASPPLRHFMHGAIKHRRREGPVLAMMGLEEMLHRARKSCIHVMYDISSAFQGFWHDAMICTNASILLAGGQLYGIQRIKQSQFRVHASEHDICCHVFVHGGLQGDTYIVLNFVHCMQEVVGQWDANMFWDI